MSVYLAERCVGGPADLQPALARLEALGSEAGRDDGRVRLLWSARVPADERWFGWFAAPDAVAVADLHRRAAYPFDRIAPAELLSPLSHPFVTEEDVP